MNFHDTLETVKGEHFKTAVEFGLHHLARQELVGEYAFKLLRGGDRVEDPRLAMEVAGLKFENPLMIGAGWDKRGWAVDGLYKLGFAGTEVGSVLVHPQRGNEQPRLWYMNGAGFNRLGFNSKGEDAVAKYMDTQTLPGRVGISLGKNKLTPDDQAPWAHAAVAEHLYDYADYFVINVSSPNTPGLRALLDPEPLENIVRAVRDVLFGRGEKPLFIKTTVDLITEDLDEVLGICEEESVGIIDTNTTIDQSIKQQYGWDGIGGVSGDNPIFRQRATERMKYITRMTRDKAIPRIGVGGINDVDTALERIEAGAQVVQIVTGMRHRGLRIARNINLGLLERIDKDGAKSLQDYVGIAA